MRKTLLSINGNRAMNYLLQTIFEKEYQFVPVADVFHAMHHLKTNKEIVTIIVDVDFCPQQCWEMIGHIKTSKLYQLPVIVLATDNNEVLKEKCYDFGVDEIFVKPFDPADLKRAVKAPGAHVLAKV
jgi:DNA-binding response OmpR family regulator